MIGIKTRGSMFRSALIGIALLWLLDPAARADEFDREVRFSIAPQSLASAVMDFAEQSKIQVVTSSTELERYQSQGVSGRYAVRIALAALLDGTGLAFREVGRGTVSIGRVEPVGKVDGGGAGDGIRLAQADPLPSPQEEGVSKEDGQLKDKLEEVVVQGAKRKFAPTDSSAATKIPMDIIDTPQSLSVLSSELMSIVGAKNLSQALAWAPSATVPVADISPFEAMPYVRGFRPTDLGLYRINGMNMGSSRKSVGNNLT